MEKISNKKRVIFIIVSIFIFVFTIEMICRIFWTFRYHVNFYNMKNVIYVFYPQIETVKNNYDESKRSVLLLGASALNGRFGKVEYYLAKDLNPYNMIVFNISVPALTSLDSYYKYYLLKNYHFDAVVFYHGINETRANNCPPDMFRKDYSHYSWYLMVNAYFKHKEIQYLVFPYTFTYLFIKYAEKTGLLKLIPMHDPIEDYVVYGDSIKTVSSFRENLRRICEIAESKGDGKVIVPLFLLNKTSYVDTTLNYACRVSLWGIDKNVRKGVELHNMVIKELSNEMDNLVLIDTYSLMERDSTTMVDICHFNDRGSRIFAGILRDTILKYVEEK